MFSKENIRQSLLKQRMNLTENEVNKASKECLHRLMSLAEYQDCNILLLYAPIRNEVDTFPLIEDALSKNKVVGLPVTEDEGEMYFYSVFDLSDLKPGKFGILEPPTDILVEPTKDTLMLLPAVAYDTRKNRIGYGGGYYDRYLARYEDFCKIGLAYDFQIMDGFEVDEHDQRVNYIITQSQLIV